VIPERLLDALMNREKDVINPREYYEYVHFSDAVMTDQEILEMPKVWVVGGDGGMGDIGYQNMSKVILQNRPNVKAVMLDTQGLLDTRRAELGFDPDARRQRHEMFGRPRREERREEDLRVEHHGLHVRPVLQDYLRHVLVADVAHAAVAADHPQPWASPGFPGRS